LKKIGLAQRIGGNAHGSPAIVQLFQHFLRAAFGGLGQYVVSIGG
jgi:hypothetical protein